ncbi:MAG: hypothetical protein LBK83_14480, partial [Treponema sp.]|nr:hypothetical protein [Treponema sp.]
MKTAHTVSKGLTFEKVWAAIQATNEQMKATNEQMKETDRQMKATDRRLGELTNRFGDMVEYMVLPNL